MTNLLKKTTLLVIICSILAFAMPGKVKAETILYEDFEDNTGFTIGGGYSHYWDIAPLEGTVSIPSNFEQGGSQSGKIFYGSFAKGGSADPAPTMSVNLPDLTGYSNLKLIVSLAAPDCTVGTCWEISHRDRLVITASSGEIDRFLPISGVSPLVSQYNSSILHYEFQDFEYPIVDNTINSITFEFASTAYDEVVGIDSVMIYGEPARPMDKDECKKGGWKIFSNPTFKNQGACVSYVVSNENAGK